MDVQGAKDLGESSKSLDPNNPIHAVYALMDIKEHTKNSLAGVLSGPILMIAESAN